jgi:hypothetical protein
MAEDTASVKSRQVFRWQLLLVISTKIIF